MVSFENHLAACSPYKSVMVYEPVAVSGLRKNEFPIAVVIKTEKEIHDCWLNFFAPEERGKEAIKALGMQEDICFHFINNLHDRVRSSVFVGGGYATGCVPRGEG